LHLTKPRALRRRRTAPILQLRSWTLASASSQASSRFQSFAVNGAVIEASDVNGAVTAQDRALQTRLTRVIRAA
jgi:hypothetical protein